MPIVHSSAINGIGRPDRERPMVAGIAATTAFLRIMEHHVLRCILPHRKRPAWHPRSTRRRLLRDSDAARSQQLPPLRRAARALPETGGRAGHGQAGRRRRQPRAGAPERRQAPGDQPGLRAADPRRLPRPVRGGHDPGRRRHLDQHERQRGDRQPGARIHGSCQGRVSPPAPEQRREHGAVDQRRLPHGDPPGPAARP